MSDMDKSELRQTLSRLYADLSKHSTYQNVPDFVADSINYRVEIDENWRGDRVRLRYLERRLAGHESRRWADFGANTGFFSLSLAHAHPTCHVTAIEANSNHAAFIKMIADAFELSNIDVLSRSVSIEDLGTLPLQDVMLHLNVLHHAGSDFDKGRVEGTAGFLVYATEYLRRLSTRVGTLVFQVGTNLWGDKSKPIIDYRDDVEKLVLLSSLLRASGWHIESVAYPHKLAEGTIEYDDLPADLDLQDRSAIASALTGFNLAAHRGEFYRRPLFVCRTT